MTTGSYWIDRAVIGGEVHASVRIEHRAGNIDRILAGASARPQDVVLHGTALPGFANAHSHAFHRALRGRTHADGGTFWHWRNTMYRIAGLLDPDSYRQLATAVFAEMALAGISVVGEFHYLHHQALGLKYGHAAALDQAVVDAAAVTGIRLTLLDTLYLRGGLSGLGTPLPLTGPQQRFTDNTVSGWLARHQQIQYGPLARPGAAIHSARAVDPAQFAAFRDAAGDVPIHAHVSEQPAENEQVLAAYGATPIELFHRAGLLGPRFTAVHATHLTEADIRLLGETGSFACFCPTTERDLADGIGPAMQLHEAGAHLCLGSDQHVMIDPFEELRGLEMHERLATGQRGRFTPKQLLTAATKAGYDSLGWGDGGELQAGALCDFVVIGDGSPRTAGSATNQVWLAATAADVRHLVVAGQHIVKNGAHRLGDVGSMLSDAIALIDEADAQIRAQALEGLDLPEPLPDEAADPAESEDAA